jgi:hypothetical protein
MDIEFGTVMLYVVYNFLLFGTLGMIAKIVEHAFKYIIDNHQQLMYKRK